LLRFCWGIEIFTLPNELGNGGAYLVVGWSRSAWVAKASGDHELRAFAKRPLDFRALNWATIVESTLPEGHSKGQEQHGSFQVVVGFLGAVQHRVLANIDGKMSPPAPVSVGWSGAMVDGCCSIKQTTEVIPSVGRANCQCASCAGRGWR
jgi:hypothetical protein